MKNLFLLALISSLALFCSCQKQQTEEERNAEIERQVQQRLAAERQAQHEQELARRETELESREKALAEKQRAAEQPADRSSEASLKAARIDHAPAASYSTFYRKLEPYGIWRETSNYGYVWQPYEAERSSGWRPYIRGRWVYTDAGWTWISDEPFGWATYHYGRWTRLRNIGWVWVPGDEWAPAWVSWRKGNDYIGWAPLPPEAHFDRRTGIRNWADNYYEIGPDQYCFVPANQLGARRVETAVVPVQRNVTIVNQTTNVTNITYSNTTIVNEGPRYDEVRARSQQPIERLRLERQSAVDAETETPQAVIRGDAVQIPAPVIAKAQPVERPRNVREKIAEPAVERGWEGIADREAAEKARAKIKSESTLPADVPPKKFVKPEQAPLASPMLAATQTPPPSPREVPATTATVSPAAPPRRGRPVASPSPVRDLVPSPTPTPAPRLRETPEAIETATPTPFGRMTPIAPGRAPAFTPASPITPPPRVPQTKGTPPRTTFSPTHRAVPETSPAFPDESPRLSPSPDESPKERGEKRRQRDHAAAGKRGGITSPSATPEAR